MIQERKEEGFIRRTNKSNPCLPLHLSVFHIIYLILCFLNSWVFSLCHSPTFYTHDWIKITRQHHQMLSSLKYKYVYTELLFSKLPFISNDMHTYTRWWQHSQFTAYLFASRKKNSTWNMISLHKSMWGCSFDVDKRSIVFIFFT